jgi:hypothetical protein
MAAKAMARRRLWLMALAVLCLQAPATASAQSAPQSQCSFSATFRQLVDAALSEIGLCRGPELTDTSGDIVQATARGLLQWRKAESWTGFIGPKQTVILTDGGVVRRSNLDRFDWELTDGASADTGLYGDPSSGLLPPTVLGLGYDVSDAKASEAAASSTIDFIAQTSIRGPRSMIQTVQVLPSPDLAHALFLDLGNLQQGDMTLKTVSLADETAVVAWRPDDPSTFGASFRQLAIRTRRSNAVVTVVLIPGTRVDLAVQLASMILGRLR